ncbi:MAG: sialidase family protein [Planctomycetaceae bacterium]|nr:sialidase family protein [Planctomycetaceae bacterium]
MLRLSAVSLILAVGLSNAMAAEPVIESELVFPLHDQHNHAPGIAELADGSLFVSWYRGSGERRADDVAVWGTRQQTGKRDWSEPFVLVDTPGFPDCNTCLMVDARDRLWLFWPVILANSWESCLTRFQVADQPTGSGCPMWSRDGTIFLKPDDFSARANQMLDDFLRGLPQPLVERAQAEIDAARLKLSDKLSQRLGWQPRCKPTVLPSGRILLPLYSDTFSCSIMAISDDEGRTWSASQPLLGFGNIQPSVLRRDDGTLVAYMRENGVTKKIRRSESSDDGVTWSPVDALDLPNPGSGLDAVRLKSGAWLLVYNDTLNGRNSLAVSRSTDEGRTWPVTRHLERAESGQYHYPAIIQTRDGRIHVVYSYFVAEGKSMKHAAFGEDWLTSVPK